MKIKKTYLYIAGLILLLALLGFYLLKDSQGKDVLTTESSGETQVITLSMKNYNYYPETIHVKANQPVEIHLDESVYGCLRDFTIRDFNIHENLKTPEDSVIFTPTKKGTYSFACSMGMAYGKIIVE